MSGRIWYVRAVCEYASGDVNRCHVVVLMGAVDLSEILTRQTAVASGLDA